MWTDFIYVCEGGTTRAQWEDVTGSTPLTFVNDCVSFTTTVSARFWLMDCRNIGDATKMATELYRYFTQIFYNLLTSRNPIWLDRVLWFFQDGVYFSFNQKYQKSLDKLWNINDHLKAVALKHLGTQIQHYHKTGSCITHNIWMQPYQLDEKQFPKVPKSWLSRIDLLIFHLCVFL